MSQQRSCCCGVDQEFGLECLHGDKVTPAYLRSAISVDPEEPPGVDTGGATRYRQNAVTSGTQAAHATASNTLQPLTVASTDDGQLIYYNTIGGRQGYKETRGLIHVDAPYQGKNGLGLSDRPETSGMGCMLCHGALVMSFKAKSFRGNSTDASPGGECSLDDNNPSCKTRVMYYRSEGYFLPEEQPMHVLYVAVKDLWYFERGPSTLPYTLHDESVPMYEANSDPDTGKYWNYPDQGGNLGVREAPFHPPSGACRTTIPFPPTPTDADGLCYPELTYCTNPANVYFEDNTKLKNQIQKAWDTKCGPGYENTNPELADYEAQNEVIYPARTNYVCTALGSNRHPWYNWVNPATFYSGCPSSFDQMNSPCFGSYQPGVSSWQMYQCRAQPYLRHLGDLLTYGNGLRVFRSPGPELFTKADDLNPTGEPENFDGYNGSNLFTNGYASQFGRLFRCRVWVKADMFQKDGEFPCQTYFGEKTAYHPSKTNRKMNLPAELGGYSQLQKRCGSGPSVLIYACAGVPVLSSDIRELFEIGEDGGGLSDEDTDKLMHIYSANFESGGCPPGAFTTPEWNNCFLVPDIEQKLGDSGKFVAKDWRADQLEKWDTLENQFKAIAAEAIASGEIEEGDTDYTALSKYAEGVQLGDEIRNHITPREVDSTWQDANELLPVQKAGREFLTFLINRATPKERANGEPAKTRLTEMVDYQASEFLGENNGFVIDQYDPWHPNNSKLADEGIATASRNWKKLGVERGKNHPITYRRPDGVTEEFEFRYPLRAAYRALTVDIDTQTSPYDPGPAGDEAWREIVPEWEEKLFEAWYKNNPIYIHSVPGGWSYAGLGDAHAPDVVSKCTFPQYIKESCMPNGQEAPHNLCESLDSIWQLNRDEYIVGSAADQPGLYKPESFPATDVCDSFPNYTYFSVATGTLSGAKYWNYSAQLRNRPASSSCRVLPEGCAKPGCVHWLAGGTPCADGFDCCGIDRNGPPSSGPAQCYSSGYCQGIYKSSQSTLMRNCCGVSDPYSGRSANSKLPIGKATQGIALQNPSSIGLSSSQTEIKAWGNNNPSQSMEDDSIYGIRCSESGGCPPNYECCCPSGCDGDCFCIPEKIGCKTPPCSSQNEYQSPCCQSFGSCCYVDENGIQHCIDNITEEECIARKSLGGLDGTFNRDGECNNSSCATTVRGSCFYTDKLLDHQVCRDTTKETCAELNGEFYENQPCSDFPEKITTAYETVVDKSGVKPQFPGDRSCGRFGFSVNCCTEEFDEATGTTIRTCEPKCLADCDIASGNSRIVSNCESCQSGEEGELGHCCTLFGYCKPNVTRADCWGIWGRGTECTAESCITQGNYNSHRNKRDLDLDYDSKTNWPDAADNVYEGISYRSEEEDSFGGYDVVPGVEEEGDLPYKGTTDWCNTCPPFGIGVNAHVCANASPLRVFVASRFDPAGVPNTKPFGGCGIRPNNIFDQTCVIKSIQVSKTGFRHVSFTSVMDDFGINPDSACPLTLRGTLGSEASCCKHICNPQFWPDGANCGVDWTDFTRGIQDSVHSLEVTVYPYKIRCQQTREVGSGFWRCGILDTFIPASNQTDYAVGVAGVQDFLTCHQITSRRSGPTDTSTESCTDDPTACVGLPDGPGTQCEENGEGQNIEVTLLVPPFEDQLQFRYAPDRAQPGGFCPNYSEAQLRRAYSIPFPDQGNGEQYIYAPEWGMGYIPKVHCASGSYKNLSVRPRSLPPGTLRDCAEFYQDKLLCDITNFYDPPPPVTDLIFHDYGGLTAGDINEWICGDELDDGRANWFKGASAEYVDAFFDDSKNSNEFWIKKEFPSLEYIRLFGVGCYDIPGSFAGGRGRIGASGGVTYEIGGEFAGTMVLNFGSTTEFQNFDETYGAENLSLKFLSKVPNQPEVNPIGGIGTDYTHTFIAQPSRNFNKESDFNLNECDNQSDNVDNLASCEPFSSGADSSYGVPCDYKYTGWLNGRGLTYANIATSGLTAEITGKVYEFCSFLGVNDLPDVDDENSDEPNQLGGQLKPIFRLPDDEQQIPHYSGVRGPLVLYARNEQGQSAYDMSVDLSLTSTPPPGGSTCGACYGQLGEAASGISAGNLRLITGLFGDEGYEYNDDAELNPRIKENCINYTAVEGVVDWHNTYFVPGYSGITTDGAKGCCSHNILDPLDVFEGTTSSQQPCNQWQEAGEELHHNPARTYGEGGCICNEDP